MRRLTRLLTGRRASGERGAVLVLSAVLVMFVAIGMLALTVDLGNITYNRAQLQNGADASSLALAAACAQASATGPQCGVTSSPTDPLTLLAEANGNASTGGDQSMSVLTNDKTCISQNHTVATTLPNCPLPGAEDTTSLSRCQPVPASVPVTASYVEVTTQTEMKGGGNILPFHFAQIFGGEESGTTSETCARAAWGPAGSTGATIPATISQCAFKAATLNGYAPAPPYATAANPNTTPQPPTAVQPYITAIKLHAKTTDYPCADNPNNQTYPGGFGWLATSTDPNEPGYPCVADITYGDPTAGDSSGGNGNGNNGRPPPQACKNNTLLQNYVGEVVGIPIYDNYSGTGSGGTYEISGIAAFYLAGYNKVNTVTNKDYEVYADSPACTGCTGAGSDTYLWGWFVNATLPTGGTIGTGPDMGAHIVVPAG